MSVATVIAKFDGIRPMARTLGIKNHSVVQGWLERELIPAHRQRHILEAAKRLKIKITASDLIPAERLSA